MPGLREEYDYRETLKILKEKSGRAVPLAITEYNVLGFGQEMPVPYRHCLGAALVNAEMLKVFMKPENKILMANYWQFVNEYWGIIANGFDGKQDNLDKPYYKRPNFYVFELYKKHFGNTLLETRVECDSYTIKSINFTMIEEIGDKVLKGRIAGKDILSGTSWEIVNIEGVDVHQENGIIEIFFKEPRKFNYFHTHKKVVIEPGTYYKLSGYVKTQDLEDAHGICLNVIDGRGWVTRSAVSTDRVKGTNEWTFVEAVYKTLPDAKEVLVEIRRVGEAGPLHGKVFVKDVLLNKFVPNEESLQIPFLSVNASKNSDGSKVYLLVVNKDMDKSQTATITLNGFEPASKGNAWILNGPAVDSTNEKDYNNVKVMERTFQVSGYSFEFTFEPHSLTAIELTRSQE